MPSTCTPAVTVGGHAISHFTRIGRLPARSIVFHRYSDFERRVLIPHNVSVKGCPSARMLKSVTSCVPGHEPVERAVQPGGVSVGNTPTMGR